MRSLLSSKKTVILVTCLILLIVLPLLLSVSQKKQETRSGAHPATTLVFSPANVTLQRNQTTTVDIYLDPGTNWVTFARLVITYDATKMEPSGNKLVIDTTNGFPAVESPPAYTAGRITTTLSIGGSTERLIRTRKKIASLTMHVLPTATCPSGTSCRVNVTFDATQSKLYSINPSDSRNQNVLSAITPLTVTIQTVPPSITPIPSATRTPTPSPTRTPTPSPTTPPSPTAGANTTLQVNLSLDGVSDPGGNIHPRNQRRDVTVQILKSLTDGTAQLVKTVQGFVDFNTTTASFSGAVTIADLPNGDYIIKIKSPRYLNKRLDVVPSLRQGQTTTLPYTSLIAGDMNDDNELGLLDYQTFRDCYLNRSTCTARDRQLTDIDDNGVIDGIDYNYFIYSLSHQEGD